MKQVEAPYLLAVTIRTQRRSPIFRGWVFHNRELQAKDSLALAAPGKSPVRHGHGGTVPMVPVPMYRLKRTRRGLGTASPGTSTQRPRELVSPPRFVLGLPVGGARSEPGAWQ